MGCYSNPIIMIRLNVMRFAWASVDLKSKRAQGTKEERMSTHGVNNRPAASPRRSG